MDELGWYKQQKPYEKIKIILRTTQSIQNSKTGVPQQKHNIH